MQRRLWISIAFTIPLLLLMISEISGSAMDTLSR